MEEKIALKNKKCCHDQLAPESHTYIDVKNVKTNLDPDLSSPKNIKFSSLRSAVLGTYFTSINHLPGSAGMEI